MAVHVSVVPDAYSKAQVLLLGHGKPMLSISDVRSGVTFTLDESPEAAAQAVVFARDLLDVVGQFAEHCERYAGYVADQYRRQQHQAALESGRAEPG